MLNAAIPSEAFGMEITNNSKKWLRHFDWVEYDERTWCSYWHNFFLVGDDRMKLTWINRFSNISGDIRNYYTTQDEVLKLKEFFDSNHDPNYTQYAVLDRLARHSQSIQLA